ncbi:putative serine/threonine-protein kinase pix13 [Castilleja foliolosa]|uniref:non-specific serine/threonine protein kinase n=1 Tax=Castilleja foliolosa TaxID=1961234 RepID=A0ABD3CTG4_9LAMI
MATTQTTSNTTSSGSSSNASIFSAASGVDEQWMNNNSSGKMLAHPNLRVFSLSELRAATTNFKSDTVLGEGGFGKVYKGWLDDRFSAIAVKRLNSESMQGFEEWQSEVNFLGRLSHPNLVKLLGYGWENTELLLIYEFMQKGSLENHLFGRGSAAQPLPWDIRLQILIGAARGLAFLHSSDRKVIYRDFKASNILLDGPRYLISEKLIDKQGLNVPLYHICTIGIESPCNWFGIECFQGYVVALNLKDLCLKGTLASDIVDLIHVKSIGIRLRCCVDGGVWSEKWSLLLGSGRVAKIVGITQVTGFLESLATTA